MAHSDLHIICGTCGSKDLAYEIDPEGLDITMDEDEQQFETRCFINCKNCSTIHDLGDFIPGRVVNDKPRSFERLCKDDN